MTTWLAQSDVTFLALPHVSGIPLIRKAESTVIGEADFRCRGCEEIWAVEKPLAGEIEARTAELEDAIVRCPSCGKKHLIGRLTPDGKLLLSEVVS